MSTTSPFPHPPFIDALLRLAEEYGVSRDSLPEWAMRAALSSVCPGVCMDPECGEITHRCEPDAEENWCHACDANTVTSLGVLAIITDPFLVPPE